MRTIFFALLAMAVLAPSAAAQNRAGQVTTSLPDPVLRNAMVKVKRDLMLPAKDNGALVELAVAKGDTVEQSAFLGQIDDTEAFMAHAVAMVQWKTAEENAGEGSRIQLEFAEKAAAVARHEYQTKFEAMKQRDAVTAMEVKRAELEWQKSEAQIAVRHLEEKLAQFEVEAKKAELDAAEKVLQRRRLTAPFAGIVEETYRREGEWVQAGEPILRLMDFTTMTISAPVDAKNYSRQDVDGRPVTVHVELPRGEQLELKGQITVVSPMTNSLDREFTVEAEVPNQQLGRHWLLAHGDRVTMTIHVN